MFEPSDEDPTWRTTAPFTYIIDYSSNHVGNEEWIKTIAEAPPTLLHVGHDVPFKSMYGPADKYDFMSRRMLDPDEIMERIKTLSDYVSQLHRAGVKIVIPYVCSMFIFGDPKERRGFWRFYDNWEEYSQFGFGSKPKTDPVSWCYQKPRPLGFEEVKGLEGNWVYEPSIDHPDWRRFLRTVVGHIAKVGYDGVFVDVNASACRKGQSRKLFREFLLARYTQRELNTLFGFGDAREIRLGRRGEGLLWLETVRFRGERMSGLFHELRNEGRRYRDSFIVIPNLSPFQHVDGVWNRVGISQVFSSWARECPVIMFEEMQQPGLLAPGVTSNFAFQYKYAFAQTARAGCLLYNAQDRPGVELSMAEAAAGGGGAFIQPGFSCPEVRRKYRAFLSKRRSLYHGLVPHSSVGLAFFYEQLAWGTRTHLEKTQRIAEELMARHVLFDLVVERNLRSEVLRGYRAIICSDLQNLSEEHWHQIRDYLKEGGSLLAIGGFGLRDGRGNSRACGVLASEGDVEWVVRTDRVEEGLLGKGRLVRISDLDAVVSPKPFELFKVSEEDSLDLERLRQLVKKSGQKIGERRRELLGYLEKLAGRISLSDCEETLRFSAYRATEGQPMIVLHCVNYNIPIQGRGSSGAPIPTGRTAVELPIPRFWNPESVEIFNPPDPVPSQLKYQKRKSRLIFTLPPVDTYSVVRVNCTA